MGRPIPMVGFHTGDDRAGPGARGAPDTRRARRRGGLERGSRGRAADGGAADAIVSFMNLAYCSGSFSERSVSISHMCCGLRPSMVVGVKLTQSLSHERHRAFQGDAQSYYSRSRFGSYCAPRATRPALTLRSEAAFPCARDAARPSRRARARASGRPGRRDTADRSGRRGAARATHAALTNKC